MSQQPPPPLRFAFLACLAVRAALAALAKFAPARVLPYLGAAALLPATCFLVIYAFGLRKTGAEVAGGRIWWNDLRPLHALLYYAFAALALRRHPYAWVPLALDVAVGAAAFARHYE